VFWSTLILKKNAACKFKMPPTTKSKKKNTQQQDFIVIAIAPVLVLCSHHCFLFLVDLFSVFVGAVDAD